MCEVGVRQLGIDCVYLVVSDCSRIILIKMNNTVEPLDFVVAQFSWNSWVTLIHELID